MSFCGLVCVQYIYNTMGEATLAYRAACAVLQKAWEVDTEAKISSITPHIFGGILVKIRPSAVDFAVSLHESVRESWPLCNCSLVENHVVGGSEVCVLIPNGAEMRRMAVDAASTDFLPKTLSFVARMLLLVGIGTFLVAVSTEVVAGSR